MSTSSEQAQSTAEYAVVLGVITLGVVLAIASLSGVILGLFDAVLAVFD
jgi:Flp pilus assembly pilin Flp